MSYLSAIPKDICGIISGFSTRGGTLVPLTKKIPVGINDCLTDIRFGIDIWGLNDVGGYINEELLNAKVIKNKCVSGDESYHLHDDLIYFALQMKCPNCPKHYYLTLQVSTIDGMFLEIHCPDCERIYRLCPKCTTQKTGQLLQLKSHVFEVFDCDDREDYSPMSMLRETDEYIFTRGGYYDDDNRDDGFIGPRDPTYICKNELGTIFYKKPTYFCDLKRFFDKPSITGPDGGCANLWECECCGTEFDINDK